VILGYGISCDVLAIMNDDFVCILGSTMSGSAFMIKSLYRR
jgi:hypothetical protein